MKIHRLSIFKEQLSLGLATVCPFTYRKEVWADFDSVFSQTVLIFLLLMKAKCWKKLSFILYSLYLNLNLYVNNKKSRSALYSLPSTGKFLFSTLTWQFYCLLDKVEKLFIDKNKFNSNIDIAVAGLAGNPSSLIAVGGVAIFQKQQAKLSIICCCCR